MKHLIKLFSLMILLVSCSVQDIDFQNREVFYVQSAGATLPVVVAGRDTEEVVLFVHGGPGLSSMIYYYASAWEMLRERYRMVFYDQRGSGGGRGHITEEKMTVDQHVEDLNVVVSMVQAAYPNSKIYLMGHSYGGLIASAYTSVYQQKIAGLILLSPALNIDGLNTDIPVNMIANFIDPWLKQPHLSDKERKEWGEIKQFYLNNTPLRLDSFLKHSDYAHKADVARGMERFDECYQKFLPRLLSDPLLETLIWEKQIDVMLPILDKTRENFRNLETDPKFNLANITVPAMLMTGTQDLVVPASSSLASFNVISSPIKNIISYPDGAHNSFLEYPVLVPDDIIKFIEAVSP